MIKTFFVVLFLLATCSTTAQKFTIKGTVQDAVTAEKLLSATVFLESAKDSTLIAYSITDQNGAFRLVGNTTTVFVNFYTSYQGYKAYNQSLKLEAATDLDLGIIQLDPDIAQLNGVLIEARKAPIVVKKDTIEFNAKSFNTNADATLEDVIKELPGVAIDANGKITVNGKEVSRLLVNGKEFFGTDPQIALKNLPKEILDKIQVTDSKTDEQKITGEDGDASKVDINVTIDEDKNKGFFSRFTAGGGTDDRFQLSGIANYFKDDLRVSALASANNINSPGFTFDEVYDAMGRGSNMIYRNSNGSFGFDGVSFGSGDSGITTSQSAGFNLANDWGKKVSLTGNYFYGSTDNIAQSDTRSTTFLPDRTFSTGSNTRSTSAGDSHRFSSVIQIKPDTLTSFRIAPLLEYRNTLTASNTSIANRNESADLINQVVTDNLSNTANRQFKLDTYVNRNLKVKGSFIGWALNFDDSSNKSENDFNSLQQLFVTVPQTETQDQFINQEDNNRSITVNPSVRLPIAENWFVKTSYNFGVKNQTNNRSVFDRDTGAPQGIFNADLSTAFELQTTENSPTVGVSFNNKKLRVSLDGGVNFQSLENEDLLRTVQFDKRFTLPNIGSNLSYEFSPNTSIYLSYSNSASVPNIQQLAPVENRTNPQNIITGNPDLDITQQHDVYISFNSYNWETGNGLYAGTGMNFVQNQVGTVTITDADLIRRTTYTNLDDGYNGWFYSNYSRTFKKDKRTISAEIGIDGNFAQNFGFTNGLAFQSNSLSLSPNTGFNYAITDIIKLRTNYSVSFNNTRYDIASIQDQEFTNHNALIDITTFWPKNVTIGLRGEYNVFGNITDEFDNDSFVVIGSLGYKFAGDKASLKLTAYDLLNQVIDTRRVVTSDFVSDTSSLVLQQYFMASFTYKFTKFATEKKENDGVIFF